MEKQKITQEDTMKFLNSCYEKCLSGLPMVSQNVEDMAGFPAAVRQGII